MEECTHLLFGHVFDPVDVKQRGFSTKRLHFLHEPLEELDRLGVRRQNPRRTPKPDSAHALQLAPHTDAMPCRRGWQRHQQREPPHQHSP